MKIFPSRCGMYTILLLTLAVFVSGASGDSPWTFLRLKDHAGHLYRASSELQAPEDNSFGRYGMHRVFDGNLKTCWAEGAADAGADTTLYLAVPAATPSLSIANGYQKSLSLYQANNRVKTARLSLFVGVNREGEASELFTVYHTKKFPAEKTVSLQDTFGFQKIPLPFDWPRVQAFKERALVQFKSGHSLAYKSSLKLDWQYILQIKLVDVFSGSKYSDTCISEIMFDTAPRQYPVVEKIYVNKPENTIFMDTKSASNIILDQDPHAVFQIVAVSANRQWVIVIKMPAEIGSSRAETTYVLYNTRLKSHVPPKTLGADVGEMYDFEQTGGKTYLNYLNNKTMEIDRLDLNAVYRKLADSN